MTTEGELNLTEVSWGDHRIRLIQLDSGKYVPVGDIAGATGVRKRSYHNLMDKYPDEFLVHERWVSLSSPGGSQETRCIDEAGAYTLLKLISANHIKDDASRKKLIEFKEWMQIRAGTGGLAPRQKEPDYDAILRKIHFVNQLSEMTGWNKLELQKEVLRENGLQSLTWHIEPEQPALSPAPAPEKKFKGYYNATDIGELCGKSGKEINQWLYNNGYIIKGEGDEWKLTELGKDYAYEHQYCPPGTFVLRNRIEWKKEILEKMNIHKPEAPA